MNTWTRRLFALALTLAALLSPTLASAADLRIVIMQAQAGDARRYQSLLEYLASRGIPASFVTAPDAGAASEMFAAGKVDLMFAGSGVAGTLMMKGFAEPLVRPVGLDGVSTYSAVVIAPKGSPRFTGAGTYFDGKRVIYSGLASAGEFFFESLGASRPAAKLKASSHGAAIDALSRGQADVAVVKNHVWTKEASKFPGLELVGSDAGVNPDNTLIASKRLDPAVAQKLSGLLLGIEGDASPAAADAKGQLKIRGFVATTAADFSHTLGLLKRAGVTKDFAFRF